jgi:A/G-specific adenine glycosylase
MTKLKKIRKEKIEFFRSNILQWFKIKGRHFPWRNRSATNYEKIMSEVLLQRTKAETVARFYPGILKKYPNWKRLGTAAIEELEVDLNPLGLYKQRAQRVFQLAREMKKRNGRLPKNYEEIKTIPMFGQYITNAVMLLVYEKPYPLLDVNMSRVLERFFGPRDMSDIRYDPYLQDLAYKIIDGPEPRVINWAILDFAAAVCKARNPACEECPLNGKCKFYRENRKVKRS